MPDAKPQIALIGFMGTGKSTVGSLLALALGYCFLDLDTELAVRAGCSIPEIFTREGESGFRLRERRLLREVCGRPQQVLSTGGGIVLDPANVETLRHGGRVIALTASVRTIQARVGVDHNRPLLAVTDPVAAIAQLLSARDNLYRAAADFILDTDCLAPDEAAGQIAAWCRTDDGGKKPGV